MEYLRARVFVERFAQPILFDERPTGILGLSVSRMDQGPVVGPDRGDFCISVYVERLLSGQELEERGLFHARGVCEGWARSGEFRLERDELQIIPVGDEFRLQPQNWSWHASPPALNTQKWFKSLMPGIGIANPTKSYPSSLEAGTIGFFVRDDQGTTYIVSCNHVLALERKAGDSVYPEPIVQPATRDLAGSDLAALNSLPLLAGRFKVAELSAFVPVATHGPNPPHPVNHVDAALAELDADSRDLDDLNRLPYGSRIMGVATPFRYDPQTDKILGSRRVHKIGRTTGATEGFVSGLDGVLDLRFAGRKALFEDQLIIRPTCDNTGQFSNAGDSGSALMTDGNEVAGLVFAGGPERSLANQIDVVMSELNALVSPRTLAVVT